MGRKEVPDGLCVWGNETRGVFWICTECRSKPATMKKRETDWDDGNIAGEMVVWTWRSCDSWLSHKHIRIVGSDGRGRRDGEKRDVETAKRRNIK